MSVVEPRSIPPRFFYRTRNRFGWFVIMPVGKVFALRLASEFLGLYATAEAAARAAASGRTRVVPAGVNMLRLNAPFDLERWEKMQVARLVERTTRPSSYLRAPDPRAAETALQFAQA